MLLDDPTSPFGAAESGFGDYAEQMENVEMNENILIGSRSQASSFVVQGDRIQSLETENMNLNVQQ